MAGHIDNDDSLEDDRTLFDDLFSALKDVMFPSHYVAQTSFILQSTTSTATRLQHARITTPPAPLELRQNNPQDCTNLIIASVNRATVEISRTIIALNATFSQQLQQASIDASNSVRSAQNSASSTIAVIVKNADIANSAVTSISSASVSDVLRLSASLTLLQANVASLQGLAPHARTITRSNAASSTGSSVEQAQPLPTVKAPHNVSLTIVQVAAIVAGAVFLSLLFSFVIYFLIMKMRKKIGRDSYLDEKNLSSSLKKLPTRNSSTARTGHAITIRFNPRKCFDPSAPRRSSLQSNECFPTSSPTSSRETSQLITPRAAVYTGNAQLVAPTTWPLTLRFVNESEVSSNQSPSAAPTTWSSPSDVIRQVNTDSRIPPMAETPETFFKLKKGSNPMQGTQRMASELPSQEKSSLWERSPEREIVNPFDDPVSKYIVEESSEDPGSDKGIDDSLEDQISRQTIQDPFDDQVSDKTAEDSCVGPIASHMGDDKLAERVHLKQFDRIDEIPTTRGPPREEASLNPFEEIIAAKTTEDTEVNQLLENLTESPIDQSQKEKAAVEQLHQQQVSSDQHWLENNLAVPDSLVKRAVSPPVVQEKYFVRENSLVRDESIQRKDADNFVAVEQRERTLSRLRQDPFIAAVETELSSPKLLSPTEIIVRRDPSPLLPQPIYEIGFDSETPLEGLQNSEREQRGRSMLRTSDIIQVRSSMARIKEGDKSAAKAMDEKKGEMDISPTRPDTVEPTVIPSDLRSTNLFPLPRLHPVPAEPKSSTAPSRDDSSLRSNPIPKASSPHTSESEIPVISRKAEEQNSNEEFSDVLSKFQNLAAQSPSYGIKASTEVTQRAIAGIYIPGSLREQAVRDLSRSRDS